MNIYWCLGWCVYLALLPQWVWAWTKDYQTQYLLGDNDSRLTAKQHALSQIQLQAMQEAGTYIQGQTQLINEQLEERINQISAAIVKVEVLAERFELTANGQQKLLLSARANVDESILQERVRALQFDANKSRTLEKLAQDNQTMNQQLQQLEQQKLALENQLLRQKLSQLEQQPQLLSTPKPKATHNVVVPVQATMSEVQRGIVSAAEGHVISGSQSSVLMTLTQALQKTPVMIRLNAEQSMLKIQADWKLSLMPESPIAELCRRWTCVLAYAYKAPVNDALITPLHQQLFRPFSRVIHIEDKYVSHWQLLTLQAYPPHDLTAQDARLLENYRLMVRVNLGAEQLDLPLVQYDKSQGALVVAVQGAVTQPSMTAYNYQTREGYVMCALTNSTKQCANTDLTQFTWHTVSTLFAKGLKINTQIVKL